MYIKLRSACGNLYTVVQTRKQIITPLETGAKPINMQYIKSVQIKGQVKGQYAIVGKGESNN